MITYKKIKLAGLYAQHKVTCLLGMPELEQRTLENIVINRTALKVAQEMEANNTLFGGLQLRCH